MAVPRTYLEYAGGEGGFKYYCTACKKLFHVRPESGCCPTCPDEPLFDLSQQEDWDTVTDLEFEHDKIRQRVVADSTGQLMGFGMGIVSALGFSWGFVPWQELVDLEQQWVIALFCLLLTCTYLGKIGGELLFERKLRERERELLQIKAQRVVSRQSLA